MKELPPLCVDLDGTLVFNNAQTQDFLYKFSEEPSFFWKSLRILMQKGKIEFLSFLSQHKLPATSRFYNPKTLAFIRSKKDAGQKVYLVTGSHQKVAEDIGAHLGLFEGVFGSYAGIHLIRNKKAQFLKKIFGHFDYLGNSWQDLPVWNLAREKWVINPDPTLKVYLRYFKRQTAPSLVI